MSIMRNKPVYCSQYFEILSIHFNECVYKAKLKEAILSEDFKEYIERSFEAMRTGRTLLIAPRYKIFMDFNPIMTEVWK